jgi:hypothetical protein
MGGEALGIWCDPLFRPRFSPGDSRRPKPNRSGVRNLHVPRLLTGRKTATPEPKKTEAEQGSHPLTKIDRERNSWAHGKQETDR